MRWYRRLFCRQAAEKELDAELRFHLEQQIADYVAAGMNPAEARRRARLEFGGLDQVKEECRDVGTGRFLESLLRDLRYSFRQSRRNPAFTIIAVLTLALGIGANTAIFSMVNGILLQALPYRAARNLYVVREDIRWEGKFYGGSVDNGGDFLMWRRYCRSFSGIAALEPVSHNLDLSTEAVQIHGTRASANLFSILGVQPQLGRRFLPEEDAVGRNREVILTHALWQAQFNSDPKIVGKTIRLNGYDYTVVGVLPSTFYFPKFDQLDGGPIAGWTSRIQYFVPLALAPEESKPAVGEDMNFTVIARLRPGVTRGQATSDLNAVEDSISRHDPQADGARLVGDLIPLKTAVVGQTEKTLWILLAGAGFVLLIVCVNLAGLLLARSLNRTHEVAVRAALGATRWNLMRQFLVEGLLLVFAGGSLGVLFAIVGLHAIIRKAPLSIPRLESIHVDAHVLFFTAMVSIAAGLLFSLLPGLRLSRAEPGDALKSMSAFVSSTRATKRLRDVMAGVEVALCTLLLIAAVLLAKSLSRVLAKNSWLEEQHVLTADLIVPFSQYRTLAKRDRLYDQLLAKVETLPGIRAAGFSNALPLRGAMWTQDFDFQEAPLPEGKRPSANVRFVSAQYFRAIGLPLVKGRFFKGSDEGKPEVIISEGMAWAALGRRNPIGMHLLWPHKGEKTSCKVVGVVADARTEADQKAPSIVYFPYWLYSPYAISLVVRTARDPRSTAQDIRATLRRLDSQIAIANEESLQDVVSHAVASRRFVAVLGMLFASFATFLAALGLYGVISLSVVQRTHEIGIRTALGAQRRAVLGMVIGQGLRVALIGMAFGICGALALTRFLSTLLYGVKPTDPVTFIAVSLVLTAVTVLASYIPARRATKVDPMVALRYE